MLSIRTLDGGRLDDETDPDAAGIELAWRRLNLFVRLARRMGIEYDALDAALAAVGLQRGDVFGIRLLKNQLFDCIKLLYGLRQLSRFH